jgi:hypothetical protein
VPVQIDSGSSLRFEPASQEVEVLQEVKSDPWSALDERFCGFIDRCG